MITENDIEPLIELGRHMHTESPVYRKYEFSAPTLRTWLVMAVENKEAGFCAIAEDNGEIAGVFLACAGPMLISASKVAYEQTLFVYEKFRGTRAAFLLDDAFQNWAQGNCIAADVGVSAGINDDVALKFYRKRGYRDFGVTLRKEFG